MFEEELQEYKADPDEYRNIIIRILKYLAQKRHPQGRMMSLNAEDLPELPLWVDEQDSQRVFDYAWMSSLLDKVISEVEAFYTGQDKSVYWNRLYDRILRPILDNTKPPSLPQLCERYAIENQRKASNILVTVKRYFQQELIRHLRMTVLDEGIAQGSGVGRLDHLLLPGLLDTDPAAACLDLD